MKIMAQSLLLSVVAAAIPTVAYAIEINTPKVTLPHVSVPHGTNPQVNTPISTPHVRSVIVPQLSTGKALTTTVGKGQNGSVTGGGLSVGGSKDQNVTGNTSTVGGARDKNVTGGGIVNTVGDAKDTGVTGGAIATVGGAKDQNVTGGGISVGGSTNQNVTGGGIQPGGANAGSSEGGGILVGGAEQKIGTIANGNAGAAVTWSHDDESPKETVTFEYGGLAISYSNQQGAGPPSPVKIIGIRPNFAGEGEGGRGRPANALLGSESLINLKNALAGNGQSGGNSELTQMTSMQLQMLMDTRTKLLQTASDIEKTKADTDSAIVGNIKQ